MVNSNTSVLLKHLTVHLAVIMALLLAGCATSPSSNDEDKDAGAAPIAAETIVEAEPDDDFQGEGMEIPLDGTSLEAFDASLERVKRHTDEANYITLQNAISYLLVYDLEVRRSKEKLAAKLNGKTGYEVIARVGWRKPRPGKSQAEKGSADAVIIDT